MLKDTMSRSNHQNMKLKNELDMFPVLFTLQNKIFIVNKKPIDSKFIIKTFMVFIYLLFALISILIIYCPAITAVEISETITHMYCEYKGNCEL